MFYGAKGSSVTINGSKMDYVEFGLGKSPLIILPGLSDGLKTVEGQAIKLAYYFRAFLNDFKVYVFSRKTNIENGYTTREMAKDLKAALDQLGIKSACLMGISQGGMIAQHFAIDYPMMVKKLILAVTTSRANETLHQAVNGWVNYAENNDYKSLMIDTMEKTYSSQKLKTYRLMYPLLCRVGKPKSFERFILQAKAVLAHDTFSKLENIICPTFIIGGDSDKIVGSNSSAEMAEKIPNGRLLLYKGLGHASYEEGKDFNKHVKDFLLS